ncbi:FGGY-family carbohydrate kinase [Tuanshanicoccus lijuaniae]|uniref:FGGY-family carbohydrate kinase n=1 Tax=Aerococcaceae bacterium zg-1292 TaxID=2774330 RepID=UPI001BD81FFF|nr:glycerol kinase [Aerococcaceae bacterium zg-A91]MBS4457508.1 glycerol kinase [Aerococcaceae bacterium zg-BR33]
MEYVLGVDQSTQGTKVILYDDEGRIIKKASKTHCQLIDENGWVSHDPIEIYQNVLSLVKEIVNGVDVTSIKAVGITNQRETAVVWDKQTKLPIANAIVWQCARAKVITEKFNISQASMVKRKTGLPLSPYFSAAKFSWILEQGNYDSEQVACGTIDSWLVYKLTDGTSFKTDVSNASRTQLMNLVSLTWDEEICEMFNIPMNTLPNIMESDSLFGWTDFEGIFPIAIPIHSVMGDSHAALFAHRGEQPGAIKATYGTGSSIMMNIGSQVRIIPDQLAVSVGWKSQGKCHYVLEGNVNYSGAVIAWLQNQIELINSLDEIEDLVSQSNPEDQTYLIPAFSGLGAPYFRDDVTASFVGMTRKTGKAELVRAALESIAYQINAVISAMKNVSNLPINKISVDGGPTKNHYLMQFQSNLTNADIDIATVEEASCTGVAYMAGRAIDFYSDDILNQLMTKRISPEKSFRNVRLEKIALWDKYIEQLLK